MNGIYILSQKDFARIYDSNTQASISSLLENPAPHYTAEEVLCNLALLNDVEVIFSGWGGPMMDESFLAAAPRLRVVFYGAGAVWPIVSEAFWARDILLTSAIHANSIPVAEYALSQILFGLKSGWQHNRNCKAPVNEVVHLAGAYGSTVGLISFGMIARIVAKLLRQHDVNVIAFDPNVDQIEMRDEAVQKCTLAEVFERSDVVSVHAPECSETRGMIRGEHFATMRPFSTFINTARSSLLNYSDLISVLSERTDIWAVLDVIEDVTAPEKTRLRQLTNVTLTPHIAGSDGGECARMGHFMLEEFKRFLAGRSLKYRVVPPVANPM